MIVERLSDNYPKALIASSLDAIKNLCYRYASQSGLTVSIDDVKTPAKKRDDPRRLRGPGRQGRDPVPPRDHHRRRAPPAGGAHLDRRHRRGPEGDGGRVQGPAVQPDRHDGRVGRPREHDPDAPDRRDARPRRQPPRRHDPAADQEELPRGPRDARVLHRHPGRPQGTRRHRPADRRLRLPDPAPGRRRPGADRPRGGLRDHARSLGRAGRGRRSRTGAPTSRPSCSGGRCSTTSSCPTAPSCCATRSSATRRWPSSATTRRSPGCGCARCSRATPISACARCATGGRSPPASRSSSARRSASSPPSRSASPAPS